MEENMELLKTCAKGSKINCRESRCIQTHQQQVYWSKNRRSVTSTLFTRWLTSQG